MKTMAKLVFASLVAIALAASCTEGGVAVGFALTDAPISELSGVTEVNVTVSSVSINESADGTISDSDGSWKTVAIDPAIKLNLLELQNGEISQLGDSLVLTGGTQINQIRLGVDAVEIVDGTDTHTAEIPSANRTGLKIVKAFQVPLTGAATITIDFDVRKSIVVRGNGDYVVKPVLRAVVDNEAGMITGTVPSGVVTVYAYADGTWSDTEATTANTDGLYYTGAYTSALVVTAGSTYTLAFLEAGTYDLYGVDSTGTVVAQLADVGVAAGDPTSGQALTTIP